MYSVPFTLLLYIIVSFFIGMQIDKFLHMPVPVFTILFTVLGLVGGVWTAIKKTMK